MGLAYASRPFKEDSRAYREECAVEMFNAAALDMAWVKKLHPSAKSACPHVALRVLSEQMVNESQTLIIIRRCES